MGDSDKENKNFLLETLVDRVKHLENQVIATFTMYFAAVAFLFKDQQWNIEDLFIASVVLGFINFVHVHVIFLMMAHTLAAEKLNDENEIGVFSYVWSIFKEKPKFSRTLGILAFGPSVLTVLILILFVVNNYTCEKLVYWCLFSCLLIWLILALHLRTFKETIKMLNK